MGQKINPNGLRVGVIRGWEAKWFANDKKFPTYLQEDLKIRKYLDKRLTRAAVSGIDIERSDKRINISIHTAKPGMVIGKGGSEVEKLRDGLNKLTGKKVHINIIEVKKPDLEANLVGENIAKQLEGRIAFRRAMRQGMQRTMRAGAKGVKTQSSGRLNGADMARVESYSDGRVPLHTLRADIVYSWNEAHTTYGSIGVKTWINRGEVLPGAHGQREEEHTGELRRPKRPSRYNRPSRSNAGNKGGKR